MSSLAAARADNFYYPQEWRPEHGSINKFQKSHPLGKRAKDIKDGILVVRFEMPFNVWCTNCDTMIGKGVRFNARKKKHGNYFTTTIWEFQLKCANCQGTMIVRTDPKNCDYEMVSGIRKKIESFTHDQVETERLNEDETSNKLQNDIFYRLEHDQEDQRRADAKKNGLEGLIERQNTNWKDQYDVNKALRQKFRNEKKKIQKRERYADRLGISIKLLETNDEDRMKAKLLTYQKKPKSYRTAKQAIRSSSIFGQNNSYGIKTSQLEKLSKARKRGIDVANFHSSHTSISSSSTSSLSIRKDEKNRKRRR